MPAIQVVILYYGLYVISAGFILGIVCFVVGLSKAGIIAVTVNEEHTIDKTTIVVAMQKEPAANAQNNTIIKEVIMMPCEHCESLIPQTSTFCPDCGVRRKQ